MALYPPAIQKRISTEYAGYNALTIYNRVNLHIAVSEAPSLYGYFNGPGKPSSHFYVRKDGTVEQYVDTARRAEADLDGNDATISIETQGGVYDSEGEPWTPQQLEALAQMHAWIHKTHGIQLKLADDSKIGTSSKGLSWHRLGIDGNFPALPSPLAGRIQRGGGMHYSQSRGKTCPGSAKILQIPLILARAQQIVSGGEAPPVVPEVPLDPQPNYVQCRDFVKKGSRCALVSTVQSLLNNHGYRLKVDGIFGPKTEAAVREFQNRVNIVIDGIAGPTTIGKLNEAAPSKPGNTVSPWTTLKRGSRGYQVERLQKKLNLNYPAYSKLKVDGLFGPATEAVVKEFQRRSGLVPDGVVGPLTKKALGL